MYSMCVCLCVNKFIWVLVPIVATGIKYATAGFIVGVSHVTWVPETKKIILQSSILNLCRHNLFMFLICYLCLYVHAHDIIPWGEHLMPTWAHSWKVLSFLLLFPLAAIKCKECFSWGFVPRYTTLQSLREYNWLDIM